MRGQHRAGPRRTAPGRHRGAREPWRPPASVASVAGAAAVATVVVTAGSAALSGAGDPALATPSGSSSTLHGAVLTSGATADPAAVRSRPPFTGEGRAHRAGARHRAPGPADAMPGQGDVLHGGPSGSAVEPSAPSSPSTASGGGSTSGAGGAGDSGSGGGLHVEVDDDGVTVDSDLTGPVEVPLPVPLPDLGL